MACWILFNIIEELMSSQVIINADDFGLSIGINTAIERAHRKGILTSASIMPTGPAFKGAVLIARRNPKLGIGIHFSLTWCKAVSDPKDVPDLVDSDGYFSHAFAVILFKSIYQRGLVRQIELEFSKQISAVLETGIKLDHINGQHHIHFIPVVFNVVSRLARNHKIANIRIPLEHIFRVSSPVNLIKWFVLQLCGVVLGLRNRLPGKKILFHGLLFSNNMSYAILIELLKRKYTNPVEILSHPGLAKRDTSTFDYSRQGIGVYLGDEARVSELNALLDKRVLKVVEDEKIKLTTFSKLKVD